MGIIEKYWDDVTVYYVEFTAMNTQGQTRKFGRTLIFGSEVSEQEVYTLVKSRLNNIVEVTAVDELSDGLLLRDETIANH